MKNSERKLTYIPIKVWLKLDFLSRELNLTKVQILDEALTLLKEKIYDKNPNTKMFKDYISETTKIINLHNTKIEIMENKFNLMNESLQELIQKINK